MKKIILILLLAPIFARAQSQQNDRWALLFEDNSKNEKTYIDTQTGLLLSIFSRAIKRLT